MRVKLLIKNMFENRASGWSKSKEENKEIEQQVTKQEQQKLQE